MLPPKEIAPLLPDVLMVVMPETVNVEGTLFASVQELAVTLPPKLKVPVADDAMSTLPSGVVSPRAPDKTIPPVPAFSVRPKVPLMVPPNKIAPFEAEVSIVQAPDNVVGTLLVIVNELAVILLPRLNVPEAEEAIVTAASGVIPPSA